MRTIRVTLFLVAVLAAVATVSTAVARTWTDVTGKYRVEAEFAGYEDGKVQLRLSGGDLVSVPLNKLSPEDRNWVSRELRRRRNDDSPRDPGPGDAGRGQDPGLGEDRAPATTDNMAGWPQWRGPRRDGISDETGLLDNWEASAPELIWSSRGMGRGYSSLVIHDGRIYTMGKRDGRVQMICAELDGGEVAWTTPVGGGSDPNCTPTVDPEANLVFGMSHAGDLICVDARSGDERWRKNFERDFGGRMMSSWGYSESPLVDGDRLIVTPGGDRAVMAALDKRTGNVIWTTRESGSGGAGYASPVISHGGGVKQYITLVGRGLIGVAADDGRLLWHYQRIANSTANVPTSIVKGDLVFCSTGYGDGGSALLRLQSQGRAVRFQELYYKRNNELQNHHGGMVLIGDHIYMGHGHNNGLPVCVEMQSGRIVWGPERGAGSGSAAMVAADGDLYFRYENGVMALVEATPAGYRLKGSFRIASNNGKSWQHPVIFDRRLYLRDQDELHCYDLSTTTGAP